MLNKSLYSRTLCLTLLAITAGACGKNKFAEGTSTSQAYKVTVSESEPSADSTAATGETDKDKDKDKGNEAANVPVKGEEGSEQADCAQLSGVKVQNVKVSGSEQNITITKQDALAFRVTGNKNLLSVDLKNQPAESQVKAICVFAAGNQNQVKIEISNHVGAIYIVARGNQPQISISALTGAVIDKIEMDAKGHNANLSLSGEGSFPCDKSNSSISCK